MWFETKLVVLSNAKVGWILFFFFSCFLSNVKFSSLLATVWLRLKKVYTVLLVLILSYQKLRSLLVFSGHLVVV